MVSLIHVQAKSDLHRKVLANPVFIKTLTSFSQPSVLPFEEDTASAIIVFNDWGSRQTTLVSEIVNTLNFFYNRFSI